MLGHLEKVTNGRFFNVVGVGCAAGVALLVAFGDWEKLRFPIFLGALMALPWSLIVVLAWTKKKAFLRLLAVVLPVVIGLFSLAGEGQQSSFDNLLIPIVYFVTTYALGWLCVKVLVIIFQMRRRKGSE